MGQLTGELVDSPSVSQAIPDWPDAKKYTPGKSDQIPSLQ